VIPGHSIAFSGTRSLVPAPPIADSADLTGQTPAAAANFSRRLACSRFPQRPCAPRKGSGRHDERVPERARTRAGMGTLIAATAGEALRLREAIAGVDRTLEEVAQQNEVTRPIATVVGRVTAVVLVAHLGPLSDYESAAALEKACGLKLKIKSSGNYDGRVAITKRGSSVVRRYLYLAALRLIRDDVRIAAWFRSRAGYRGGRKLIAVVAVMRKLVRALWHVARGDAFDSSKLIDERALPALSHDAALASSMTSHDPSSVSSERLDREKMTATSSSPTSIGQERRGVRNARINSSN
jgi:hypothetical protein